MVAKSYQKFAIEGEPYTVNGRKYVRLSTGKQVRWYSDAEYSKMYPEEKKEEATILRPLKEVLGFDKGYITICKGDTYQYLEWFKNSDFRFSRYFGWYLCSSYELPNDFPVDLIPVQLKWEDVALPDGSALKSEDNIKTAVENVLYEPSPSKYCGKIGDKLNILAAVIKTIPLEGYFGRSTMHIFEDEEKNIFIWTTAARTLEVGKTYNIRGTVKGYQLYHNTEQTVLTRCTVSDV